MDGGARRGVEDEGEVDGGDGDEVRGVEETELGAVCVVDDEPGGWKLNDGGTRKSKKGGTHQAICSAPSWSSSLPSPVPQYRGPSVSSASASPASASGIVPGLPLLQRVRRVR